MADSQGLIAVTGSTGKLGSRVAAGLARLGVAQRLVVRDPSRAPRLDRSRVVTATYADAAAVQGALRGVTTVFMVSAAESIDRVDEHIAFIDAAVAGGVRRIVYTSFVGAAADATFTLARDHWATEQHLRASGVELVILRDNLYLDFVGHLVGADGVIRGPAGQGRVAAVAQDDIAAVAVEVLRSGDAYDGRTLDLTGPQDLSMTDIAAILSAGGGDPVGYVDETIAEAYASRSGYGAPDWQLDAWVSTYTAIASGALAEVSPDVAAVTGRPATTLRQLLA